MHVVQRVPIRIQRRMHSPYERVSINGAGLGEVDGLFKIGKMFSRMAKIKKSSFKPKNILGAIGSVGMTSMTLGLAPKISSAKSKYSRIMGIATLAVVTGGAVAAALPAGAMAAAGTSIAGGASSLWGGMTAMGGSLLTGAKALLPFAGKIMGGFGGGGGAVPQQGGMTQAEYDAIQMQAQMQAQQQYGQQQYGQQQGYYNTSGQPISYVPETGFVQQPSGQYPSMNTSYGDLRSPYTAMTENGEQVQVDPKTGQVIQPGIPTEWMIGIGGVAAIGLGLYLFSGSKSTN